VGEFVVNRCLASHSLDEFLFCNIEAFACLKDQVLISYDLILQRFGYRAGYFISTAINATKNSYGRHDPFLI
jgi:hypothetical protein